MQTGLNDGYSDSHEIMKPVLRLAAFSSLLQINNNGRRIAFPVPGKGHKSLHFENVSNQGCQNVRVCMAGPKHGSIVSLNHGIYALQICTLVLWRLLASARLPGTAHAIWAATPVDKFR